MLIRLALVLRWAALAFVVGAAAVPGAVKALLFAVVPLTVGVPGIPADGIVLGVCGRGDGDDDVLAGVFAFDVPLALPFLPVVCSFLMTGGEFAVSAASSPSLPLPRFLPCLRHGRRGVARTRTSHGNLRKCMKFTDCQTNRYPFKYCKHLQWFHKISFMVLLICTTHFSST